MGRKSAFLHPRYHVVRLLAEGGMGKVYLARDRLESEREVALKVYPARFYHDRLREEFLALKELHHPGIARALCFGVSGGVSTPFFTLEYIRGQPLDQYAAAQVSDGRNASVLKLVLDATAAVAYLHRRGVLHLDLKPDNILIVEATRGSPPRAVLIDFGLVRAVKAPAKVLGHATLPYAPPEAFSGDPPSPASDVYSIAAAFYRTLSGRLPVQGSDFESFTRAHRAGAAEPIPEAPPAVERVLLRALAKDPKRRFRDAGELHRALAQAAAPVLHSAGVDESSPVTFHEPDFVGRGQETEAFLRWLETERATRPIFEVRGGSGCGKTRFLEKLQTLLETRGKPVLHLHVEDGGEQGLFRAADHATSLLSSKQGERRTPEIDDDVATLRRRISRRLLPLLRAGTFLVIDDLHAASPAEQALVEEAASTLRDGLPATGGIIVSRTTSETAADRDEARRKATLAAGVELGPLARDEALQIDLEGLDGALAKLPRERVKTLKMRLYESSGGHPLFYVRGLLDLAGNSEAAVRLAPTERILSQVARLEPVDRNAAAALSALGRPGSIAEVAGTLGIADTEAAAAVERLRSLGLLARNGSAVRTIHESVARAATSSLVEDEVSSLHARIASFLSRGKERDKLAEAAWHFFEAGDAARGLGAAEGWLDGGKFLTGVTGSRTVQALERAAGAARPGTARAQRLLEAAGDVLEALGRFEECAKARERLMGSVETHAGPRTCDEVRRQRKLGAVCHRVGRLDLALKHLSACVTPEAETAARVESLRARADLALLHHFRGETELALEHSMRGVTTWQRSSPAERKATIQCAVNFHAVLGQLRIRRLELDDATRILQKGLQLAKKTRSSSNTALLLNNLALAHHLSGRLDTALATFEQAEAIAKELEDAAALVSIRSNVAQIHARKGRFLAARALLDELEESQAVVQSKRLRLHCFYTRGLISSLLGGETHDLWARVEAMAAEAADGFLARFARTYRAESLISSGRLSEARAILEEDTEPLLESPRLARLALIEALAGRSAPARKTLDRLQRASPAPPLLEAWNKVYRGLTLLAAGCPEDSVASVADARRIFRATGFAVGEVESALILADAHLRIAGRLSDADAGRSLLEAEREIECARGVPVDAPGDVSPRSRDLRSTLLEARLHLERLSRQPSKLEKSGMARKAALRASLQDLLARAAGDPTLPSSSDRRLLLGCLESAASRLEGDIEGSRRLAVEVRSRHEEAAALLDAKDRASFVAIDAWSRFGLERFRPPEGEPTLEARHAAALAAILRSAAAIDGQRELGAVLEEIGRATAAARVEIEEGGGPISRWTPGDASKDRSRSPGPGDADDLIGSRSLAARLSFHRAPVGWLRIAAKPNECFRACDEVFLAAAAQAIAPHLSAQVAADAHSAASPHGTDRTRALGKSAGKTDPPGKRHVQAATSPLERTHRIAGTASKPAELSRIFRSEGVVATGREMSKVMRACAAFAPTELPVLITGDSGTGKNLIAQIVHRLSERAGGPFVPQHSSAVPPELFEADLFGYERGAFTGAEHTRTGFLFQAAGGTFHLEEIGDLDLTLQQRLLRVIEERSVRPLGSTSERRLDVRFITSTQRDLEAMVRRGEFRKDLYYRLNGARIHLPSLSERKDDIGDLVEHHWRELTGSTFRFPPAALEALRAHDWPGNVRELVSVLRRLSLDTAGSPGTSDVRAALGQRKSAGLLPPSLFESQTFDEVTRKLEESYLEHLFEKHAGSVEAIAAALGTTTRSIYRRFERLGMKPKDLKSPR